MNLITNGDFQVWQNGTTFASPTYTTTADRFVWGGGDDPSANFTISRNTDTPTTNHGHSWNVVCNNVSTVESGPHLRYGMEGFDLKKLWGMACTLSFWVKSNKLGTYCISVSNSIDRSFLIEYTIDSADTWELKKVTVNFDTLSGGTWLLGTGNGVKIRWIVRKNADAVGGLGWNNDNLLCTSNQVNLHSAIGNYFRITDIQLYPGTHDQDFVSDNYQETLLKCYRYQQIFRGMDILRTPGSSCATSSIVRIPMPVWVPMARGDSPTSDTPFCTLSGTRGTDWRLRDAGDGNNTTGTFAGASTDLGEHMPSLRFESGTYIPGDIYHIQFLTTNAKLRFNAEIV